MNDYRYTLEPYAGKDSRYTCPACKKPHEFSRYIDLITGEYLGDNVGKCNRIDKCGFHYTPKQFFNDNEIIPEPIPAIAKAQKQMPRPVSYINKETFIKSLQGHDKNNLVKFLHTLFDNETVSLLINLYKIGTSTRWNGGTSIFWQIDQNDNIRTGKLIKYDAVTGKRLKLMNWVHSVLKIENFNLKQCLFGEHILKAAPEATVGIVESEKTAIIASAFFPDLIWLATGGAENLNEEKVKSLKDRNVILFPDASKDGVIFNKWKAKGDQLGFAVSDYLEKYASIDQKNNGVDIADFLINEKLGLTI